MHYLASFTNNEFQDLNPVQFGYEKCKASHFYGPTVRTCWIIHFILSGSGMFRINKKTYMLGENDIFVIPPYVETYYEADETDPWNYIWIAFTAGDHLNLHLPDVLHYPELRSIFTTMKNYEKPENHQVAFLCSKLWELYTRLQQYPASDTDYISTALSYIHSQYMNNITIESIAKKLNLERTYFSALFKKRTGLSPKHYLINYRMKIAAELLTKNDSQISTIANSVGYSDIYNFSIMFKQHFGVSPLAYRKNAKTS